MKLDLQNIKPILIKYLAFAKKYAVLIFVLVSLGVFGFLVFRIRTLASREPSEDVISEKSSKSQPINIDESAVKQVEQLQSANVDVKALFEQSRDNPFQE
jgi:hypothetical protein